ncbi:MAG: ATP-binding cassette domain-containing protein [Ardenticatenaceae bacterium]|nr:ATP-binding cassette domain-containing protein [Ardenticatenaceae bacterium]
MTEANFPKRRFLAPEVVQTSAMDCGPAALKSLLEGFGVSASYGRLREACQTDVDGTSIDTLEILANQLGLDAEQIMLPLDHLLLDEAAALPAIVVVRLPNGFTHFVVTWRVHGRRLVQIMDPATGRRWTSVQQFLDTVYQHTFPVPAGAWREWAASDEFLMPLRRRIENIGANSQLFIAAALVDDSWQGLAVLDAAVRLVTALIQSGGMRAGVATQSLLQSFIDKTQAAGSLSDSPIPAAYWSVRPVEEAEDEEMALYLRGAVLVRVKGLHPVAEQAPPLSPELAAALTEKPIRPEQQLWQLFKSDGLLRPALLLPAIFLAALGVILEAILFRGLIDLGQSLGLASQRGGVMTAVTLFLVGLLLLQMRITAHALRLGRQLDMRLRIAFLEKVPRLLDQYFHSRPISDMAQRSHVIYKMRDLPNLTTAFLRNVFTLILTVVGIIWLSPETAGLAVLAGAAALGFPVFILPYMNERDLRMQTHVGSLSRFFLDSLLGLVPIRAHGAERAVRREHEGLLVEWGRAALSLFKAVVAADFGQAALGFASAAIIIFTHLNRGGDVASILLLTYWVLSLPTMGQEIGLILRRYPTYRNVVLRLMEPLGAPEEAAANNQQATVNSQQSNQLTNQPPGIRIAMKGISVVAAGNTILQDVDLVVEPGDHVAIVGSSGAGKSSLVGLLLGWHRAASGQFRVDERPLNADGLTELRQTTAWVDPAIQLWNRSFIDNLYYGRESREAGSLPQVLEQADLLNVLRKLPDGLQTPLGEAGGLVSGGEGQRVRLGRAMLRPDIRLVVLDEPFRGLGREQRREMLRRARRLWRAATLLCITHDVSETLDFARVIVLENGRIIEDGIPAALAADPDSRYRAMLDAEEQVRQMLWSDAGWRRLRLVNGRITEETS